MCIKCKSVKQWVLSRCGDPERDKQKVNYPTVSTLKTVLCLHSEDSMEAKTPRLLVLWNDDTNSPQQTPREPSIATAQSLRFS